MTVEEFYNFILTKMTAEEALYKLLEGQLAIYESIKFEEQKAIHPLLLAAMVAYDMGWNIVIEKQDGDRLVRGILMGTEEYIKTWEAKEEKVDG